MNSEVQNFPQHYQVNVIILEGRHLALTNANTHVNVSIGKKKKRIHAKTNKTDSPYYNDFCAFNFYLPLTVLLDEILTVRVYQVAKFVKKLVGSFSVELATVWSQPNHQFHHKWAVLSDPKNPSMGIKGFLKCDLAILAKGIEINPPDDKEVDETLEENILVPYSGVKDRQRARIIFTVFRADNFSYLHGDFRDSKIIQPFVKITFGREIRKTSLAKSKENPVWNQEVTFIDFFPPLCQTILVEICDRQKLHLKRGMGNTNIDIRSLYETGVDGFLPTFGPNFLYIYQPLKKFQRHKNDSTLHSSFTYMARLLLAMRMEIVDHAEDVKIQKEKQKITPKRIPPLFEKNYFEYNKFILFATIFDVLLFDTRQIEKNISIRLTIGPKKNTDKKQERKIKDNLLEDKEKQETSKEEPKNLEKFLGKPIENQEHINVITTCNTTRNKKCNIEAGYSFVAFAGHFPCVHVLGEWPDFLGRMYQSNIIKKVIQNCTNEFNKIKYELRFKKEKHSLKLKEILMQLSKGCEVILLLTNKTKLGDTNLSRERQRFYRKEIAEIVKKAKACSTKDLKTEDALKKISGYLKTLTKFAQDPENSFPDTEIWMRENGKLIAQYRIRTEDIAYSSDVNERGVNAGKPQTIIFQGKKEKMKAKMEIFIWFGLASDFMECLKMLPAGFKHNHQSCPSSFDLRIPTVLMYDEAHHFQLRAHIYQARILIGFDDTGLADPFARVIILGQNKVTQVQKDTLNPIWDETLVFPQVTLYGPLKYIKKNSVIITVEIFDKDKLQRNELIGRSFVKPVVKLKDEKYEPPVFPPKLHWEGITHESKEIGEILIATELLEVSENLKDLYSFSSTNKSPLSVPQDIRPHNANYQLEILFWGVRELKKRNSLKNKVFVTLKCGENAITSPTIKNVRHKLNFPGYVQYVELKIPEEPEYAPPLSLKLFHIGSITSATSYVATCIIPSINHFFSSLLETTIKHEERPHIHIPEKKAEEIEQIKSEQKQKKVKMKFLKKTLDISDNLLFGIVKLFRYYKCKIFKKCSDSAFELEPIKEKEELDWWIRYQASVEGSNIYAGIPTFKVYHEELESQPEFEGLADFLQTFDMVTGHGRKIKGGILMAKVKAALKLYKSPLENELNSNHENRLLSNAPANNPVQFLVRVYIICGKNLAPRDIYGKSDPYLLVQLGKKTMNNRDQYAPKQLNPTFGKCFEFNGTFPQEYLLRIKVIDYDKSSRDDLIGETSIDIENRYYSKYHATCGISKTFEREGFNAWRDIFLPTDILSKLCTQCNLEQPIYGKDKVVIGGTVFATKIFKETVDREEIQALSVLNRWKDFPSRGFPLVPEHIETRSIYHPSLPGIEQGKLEMWVDIFPADYQYMPPKVDIAPRSAIPMELRAIVWNVDSVILDDKSLFFNEKMSDIYVKGWILSLEEDTQRTDIHYRSLNGVGNFNWRFIFHFNYIPNEKKMTVRKKIDAFDLHPEERKHHCKLEIQIWDNDAFGDDYLGTLILELCSMPRGAKLASRCTLKMLAPNASKINLFKTKRTRGWWPFRRLKQKQSVGNEFELTGKIDLELEILTQAEAKQSPVGLGRAEPNALPPPVRPATSFNWIWYPNNTIWFIFCRSMAKFAVISFVIVLIIFFFLTAFYAFPNYLVKKFLQA